MSIPVSQFVPPFPSPLGNYKFVLYVCVSISTQEKICPREEVGCSHYMFPEIRVYCHLVVKIQYLHLLP